MEEIIFLPTKKPAIKTKITTKIIGKIIKGNLDFFMICGEGGVVGGNELGIGGTMGVGVGEIG